MKSRTPLLIALFVLVPAAHGATIGAMPSAGSFIFGPEVASGPMTLIDLSQPATEDSSLTTATVRRANAPASGCAAAFKLKFLRPTDTNLSYNVFAERGPFTANSGITVVALSPAVSVQARDVIALTLLQPVSGCGGVFATSANGAGMTFTASSSDPPVGPVTTTGLRSDFILNFRASTSVDVVEAYIAAAGSTQGGFGSNFKTAAQLTNADSNAPINGRLVFHPAGVPASPSDPALPFTIPPSRDDLIQ